MTRDILQGIIVLTLRREGVNKPGLDLKLIEAIDMGIEMIKLIPKPGNPAMPAPNYLEPAEVEPVAIPGHGLPPRDTAAPIIPIAPPAAVVAAAVAPTVKVNHVYLTPKFPVERENSETPIWTVHELVAQLEFHAPLKIEFPFETLDGKNACAELMRNIIPMSGTDTIRLEYKASGAHYGIAGTADQHEPKIDLTDIMDKIMVAGGKFFQISYTPEQSIQEQPPVTVPETR